MDFLLLGVVKLKVERIKSHAQFIKKNYIKSVLMLNLELL